VRTFPGFFNARDLGGLPLLDGGRTAPGVLLRADAPDALGEVEWDALRAWGLATVIDLRNPDEVPATRRVPGDLALEHLPLDGEDEEFWAIWASGPQFGTPRVYGPHLRRMPERSAAVLAAIARARPGGVLVHCSLGRDRTGMVAAMALRVTGVGDAAVVADYEASGRGLPALFASRGEPDHGPVIREYLESRGETPGGCLREFLRELELEALAPHGFGEAERERLRWRLRG